MALLGWFLGAMLHEAPTYRSTVADPATAMALAGGRRTAAASLVWSSTVLHAALEPPGDAEVLHLGAETALTLDPTAVAPAAYGGRLLLRAGDLEHSLTVLEHGHALFPEDPWFPWIIGMQLWQEGDRPSEAVPWLRRAAELDPEGELHHLSADALERL